MTVTGEEVTFHATTTIIILLDIALADFLHDNGKFKCTRSWHCNASYIYIYV